VICRRWRIEETLQIGKNFIGLDEGQVTCPELVRVLRTFILTPPVQNA